MEGVNEFYLNEATVKTALQYYFDNVLFKAGQSPKVTSVTMESRGSYKSESQFKVITDRDGAKVVVST